MLEDTRVKTIQRGHTESHLYSTYVSIWRERNPLLLEDRESNVLQLKSSFLSFRLEWDISFDPNVSFSCLVDLVNFLDFRPR
jgi:hypothetical protein